MTLALMMMMMTNLMPINTQMTINTEMTTTIMKTTMMQMNLRHMLNQIIAALARIVVLIDDMLITSLSLLFLEQTLFILYPSSRRRLSAYS
jgi:hypothetical protein